MPDRELDVYDVRDALAIDHALTLWIALDEPLSIKQVADRYNIPTATAYRARDALVEAGLIAEAGTTNQTYHPATTYRRVVDRFEFSVTDSTEPRCTTHDADALSPRHDKRVREAIDKHE